jgi:soluble lytic murein transglycosylase
VLAIAAYNAGPNRVRQWIRDYGDPRSKDVDVIDWIESIPIGETRNYVQRVLENLQLYRLRMGDQSLGSSLATDLKR